MRSWFCLASAAAALAGCGGGGGGGGGGSTTPPPAATYSIGGSVSGLTGTGLVLQDNGGDNLTVAASTTSFTFATKLSGGTAYSVKVLTQPSNPAQTCTVSAASGSVAAANVTNVGVSCTTNTFTVSGTISGLTSGGLVLQQNGAGNLPIAANATTFSFSTPVASGAAYAVTVLTQPPNPSETCTVGGGTGTIGTANVTNVAITCKANTFTVGGTITGLTSGGLVLQNNGGDSLAVAANAASFVFATPQLPGAAYSVKVSTQPSAPVENCTVTNGTGTTGNANVATVAVTCHGFGRFLYVANAIDGANSTGDVSAFAINAATGALTPIAGSPFTADNLPSALVLDPTGQSLYAANTASADVSVFAVDPNAGGLTRQSQAPTHGVFNTAIAISPNGQYVFTGGYDNPSTNTSLFGFSRDAGTGALTVDPNSPYSASNNPYGVAVDPTNTFLFATAYLHHAVHSYTIGTAATTLLTETANSPVSTASEPYGIVVSPTGTAAGGLVFTADAGVGRVSAFSYDATGTLTELTTKGSPWPSGGQPEGLAIDPTGTYLYVANYADGTVSSFSISAAGVLTAIQASGTAVPTGNLTGVANPGPIDVKVDPTGPYVYVANQLDGSVSVFQSAAGVLTLLNTYAAGAGAVSIAID